MMKIWDRFVEAAQVFGSTLSRSGSVASRGLQTQEDNGVNRLMREPFANLSHGLTPRRLKTNEARNLAQFCAQFGTTF